MKCVWLEVRREGGRIIYSHIEMCSVRREGREERGGERGRERGGEGRGRTEEGGRRGREEGRERGRERKRREGNVSMSPYDLFD